MPRLSRGRSIALFVHLIALAAILLLFTRANAETEKSYQKIGIPWPTVEEIEVLRSLPDLEIMKIEKGVRVIYLSTPELTGELIDAGLRPEILVEPYGACHYKTERAWVGLGDFISYSEAVALLDSLHSEYPGITTEKDSIGTTWEDRPIYAMKISDNPDVNEDEPEVLFDALHHAREPITVSVLFGFIKHLLENYGSDPEATFLVDEREIWFIPVMNPDGYVYNEMVSSDMMWRKNRRDNPSSCEGVDMNRNYDINFGGTGSSGDECDQTYRGPSAFSEPETQALRDFILAHDFITHDSYHSVAALLLYPLGYTYDPAPDAALFHDIGEERNRDNGYIVQQVSDLYPASGTTLDWSYDVKGTFSYTTEVGGSDFWPQESEIPGLVAGDIYSDIVLTLNAGSYVQIADMDVTGGDGNGRLDPGETADLFVTLENPGFIFDASNVSAVLTSDDAYIQLVDAASSFGNIVHRGDADNSGDLFTVSVDAAAPDGHRASFRLTLSWDTGLEIEETALLVIGTPSTIISDDFESGNNGWTQDPSHTASTGDWVIIDPNQTEYQPGDDTTPDPGTLAWITAQNTAIGTNDVDGGISALRSPAWDLSSHSHVQLSLNYFHGQRDPGDDPSGDFFRIDLSNDGGSSFPVNLVSIGDVLTPPIWTALDLDLEDEIALTNQMVLRFQASDGSSTGDIIEGGLDDLMLLDMGTGNEPPGAPVLAAPMEGAGVYPNVELLVTNAVDPEGDPLTYGFRVYTDSLLTDRIRNVDGLAEGTGETGWTVTPSLTDGTYYWRAYAEDAGSRGPFMAAGSFFIDGATGVTSGRSAPAFALFPAKPNPSSNGTMVRFILPVEGRLRADIFDIAGRRVRSLFRGHASAGAQALHWDGRDERGNDAAPGIYFVRLRHGREDRAIKITLVK